MASGLAALPRTDEGRPKAAPVSHRSCASRASRYFASAGSRFAAFGVPSPVTGSQPGPAS